MERFGRPKETKAIRGELGCGMRGAWLDSLISKNSKTNSISVWTRSDPSGGGGFNRCAHSAKPYDIGYLIISLSVGLANQ